MPNTLQQSFPLSARRIEEIIALLQAIPEVKNAPAAQRISWLYRKMGAECDYLKKAIRLFYLDNPAYRSRLAETAL